MTFRPAHLKSAVRCAPSAGTLTEVLRQAAAERGEATFINLIDTANQPHELSYAGLLHGAERWGRWLLSRGLDRGARVALLLPTGEEFLFAFFGAQLAGAVPVPCPFPLALGNPEPYVTSLSAIVNSAAPRMFITVPNLEGPAKKLADLIPGCELALPAQVVDPGPVRPFPEVGPDDVALIQYASGRVSTPTGAVLKHQNVVANVFGLGTALELTPRDVALTWVPLVHDMGLVGSLFTGLYWRVPLHVMPPQLFLMHPYQWLKNIGTYQVTIASAPNAGYQLCVKRVQERHLKDMDLSSWRLALNGAETVQPTTVDAFCQKFAPVGFSAEAMCPTYGIAENTLATSIPEMGGPHFATDSLPDGAKVTSLGTALAGQELAVVDEQGQVVDERVEGEVVVRGACVMQGYYGEPELSRRTIDPQGWLHTGDLGFIADGHLCLTGRKKDMVIKMGRNYYPSDLEGLLAGFGKLAGSPTVAFAVPNLTEGTEDLVLLVESEPLDAGAQKQLGIEINAELLARLGIRADKIVYLAKGALGGSREAAQRGKLRRLFIQGQLL